MKGRPTLCGADAHPCAFNYRSLLAVASVIQAGPASEGRWARLTPPVSRAGGERAWGSARSALGGSVGGRVGGGAVGSTPANTRWCDPFA